MSVVPQLPPLGEEVLWDLFCRAEEIGLRLEVTDTGITWETLPGLKHQEHMAAIFGSVQPVESHAGGCECYRALDLAIRLPDGTVKRPDVSIFCRRPLEEEGFVHAVPEAVIEITSPGYEQKDLQIGPPIYLRNGIREVLVLDRRSSTVHHWRSSQATTYASPVLITLLCGCKVTV
ncbi:MAG TPA: Uma2 family endonuclease [Fimbriimonas sp.]|nr:Uma2 family endonuclease [Fimbriimonas sp.]